MTFKLSRLWSRQSSSSRARRKAAARPRFELLEDRLAPATHRWLGFGADANWTTAANWFNEETQQVGAPNSADDVLIFPADGLQKDNVNNFGRGTTFRRIEVTGIRGTVENYSLGGNLLRLTEGVVFHAGLNFISFPIDVPAGRLSINVVTDIHFMSGVISGAGGLTKDGPGRLILARANTFAGDVDVLEGLVSVPEPTSLGTPAGRTTVFAGGEVQVQVSTALGSVPEPFVLVGSGLAAGRLANGVFNGDVSVSGPVTSIGSGVLEPTFGPGGTLRLTGVLQGDAFTKTGTGEVVLGGANTYTGTTTVAAGRLTAAHPQALGSAAANTVVQSGATLQVAGNVTLAEPLSVIGQLRGTAGTPTISGPITVAGTGNKIISVDAGSTLTISGVISGPLGLIKDGPGRLVLTGANTYAGFTSVLAGVLHVGNSDALGTTTAGTRVFAGATVEVADNPVRVGEPLFLNGAGTAGSGALRAVGPNFSDAFGNITLESASTIRVDGFELELNGVISGAAAATLTKTGTGRLESRDANTFAGNLLIQQGTFRFDNDQGLGSDTGTTTVSAGATLSMSGNRRIQDERLFLSGSGVNGVGALEVRGGVSTWGGTGLDIGTITLSSANVTIGVFFGGEFRTQLVSGSGSTGLTKIGDGTLELATTSRVTGPTAVTAGTLQLGGGVTIGPATVSGTGTLSGSLGRVEGNLTANAGGVVAPGSLTVNGNVTLNAGSTYRIQMRQVGSSFFTDHIQLIGSVARTVTINNATLALTATINPPAGTQFRIIDNQTAGTTVGQFNGLPQNGTITSADGIPFRVNYFGGTDNDTVLTRNTPSMAEYVFMYPEEIYAGEYTYLVGQLTDPDEEEYLGLYISWGDGSEDQIEFPGTEQFVYGHQYDAPGEYYVLAYWFDVAGEGNFAVLTVRVLDAGAAPGGEGGAVAALLAAEAAGQQAAAPQAEAVAAPRGEQEMPRADFGLSEPAVAEVIRALAQSQGAKSDGMEARFGRGMVSD